MGKKKDLSESITKINANDLPAYMQDEEVTGLEGLKEFVIPPRIKVVQKQASDELLKTFSAGDVILAPLNAAVVEMSRDSKGRPIDGEKTSFKFVPIFFFPEWATTNPIELKGSEPFLRYRTVDPSDPVAAKAKNPGLRSEPCPDHPELSIRHVEFLNYVVVLYEHALAGEPAVMSFAKGEWGAGSKFASLIKMRKAAIYGCVFEAVVTMRHGNLGDWYGLNVTNPEDGGSWVSEEEYGRFKELHLEFAKYHKEARLRIQIEPDEPSVDDAATKGTDEF